MKILMVCLGNICRSPLAEGILKHKCLENELHWEINSAGTSNFHEGEPPHRGSIKIAEENGIDIRDQKSRPFHKTDFDTFDLILAMDSENYANILKLTTNSKYKSKVKLLLNFAYPKQNRAVPDPYFTGNFQEVYDLIDEACNKIITEHSSNISAE